MTPTSRPVKIESRSAKPSAASINDGTVDSKVSHGEKLQKQVLKQVRDPDACQSRNHGQDDTLG